jgi:hypothetical protein
MSGNAAVGMAAGVLAQSVNKYQSLAAAKCGGSKVAKCV